jgi:hypothetical protein
VPEEWVDDGAEDVDVLGVLGELETEPAAASETVMLAEPELPKASVETI